MMSAGDDTEVPEKMGGAGADPPVRTGGRTGEQAHRKMGQGVPGKTQIPGKMGGARADLSARTARCLLVILNHPANFPGETGEQAHGKMGRGVPVKTQIPGKMGGARADLLVRTARLHQEKRLLLY